MSYLLLEAGVASEQTTRIFEYSWTIYDIVTKEFTYEWAIWDIIIVDVTYLWDIYGYVSKVFTYEWGILGYVSRTYTYIWGIAQDFGTKAKHTFIAKKRKIRFSKRDRLG